MTDEITLTPEEWLEKVRVRKLSYSDLLVLATLIANGDMDNYYSGYFGVRQGYDCDKYLTDRGMSSNGAVEVWYIADDIQWNRKQEKTNAQHRPVYQDSGS